MTCKDCIHEEICDMPIITDGRKNASNCKKFKNKSDFVEVVRCEKCKYSIIHTCAITGIETLFCDYGNIPVAVEPTHFCSYGKRRTNNDL